MGKKYNSVRDNTHQEPFSEKEESRFSVGFDSEYNLQEFSNDLSSVSQRKVSLTAFVSCSKSSKRAIFIKSALSQKGQN